jgi:hypothetical protein
MKTRKWKVLAALGIAVFAVAALTPIAFAHWGSNANGAGDGTGPITGAAFGPGAAAGVRDGTGPLHDAMQAGDEAGPQYSLVAIAADKLGMSRTDLAAELRDGKTIAQVAADHKVSVDTIINAVVAQRETQLKEAVSNNQMTQAQADGYLAQIKEHVTERVNAQWTFQGPGYGGHMGQHAGEGPMYDR